MSKEKATTRNVDFDLQLFGNEEEKTTQKTLKFITSSKNHITDDLSRLPQAQIDTTTGTATIITKNATFIFDNYPVLKGLRVSTDKLLKLGLEGLFANAPTVKAITRKEQNAGAMQQYLTEQERTVIIPLNKFISTTKKDMTLSDVDTLSINTKKRIIKETRADLKTLTVIYYEQDTTQQYADLRHLDIKGGHIIDDWHITNGNIQLTFGKNFATVLKLHNYSAKHSIALLKIDGNHQTAYTLGGYLEDLQANQKDHKKRVSLNKVIQFLDLPTQEELKKKRKTYNQLVYTPIYNALEYLCNNGVLKEYTFTKAKGEQLTLTELGKLENDYTIAKKCYITYELAMDYNNT